ncbi:tetratricopeptide repeat protein [Embleya sp. NPDC127516]|uniref:tetratricopeptide repeat protein n=1 Tax=Embleya sp. NPDC127516 TaxID=3363990 RepID=UPI003818E46A
MGSTTVADRRPNTCLRERARARGWASARDLAEHLDQQAQRLGMNVVFDERTVRRWLSGHSRWPQRVHRDALEKIFGLATDQLGFVAPTDPTRQPDADTDPREAERFASAPDGADIVAALAALGGADMERREFLTATGTVLGLLSLPGNPAHGTPAAPATLARTGTVRVGSTEVDAVRTMTTAFGDAAAELGGGHARTLAVRYLTDRATPWLRGTYTDATGRELHTAVGELAHLIAWMTQDEGKTGPAQRYYAHAYRLADLGRDRELAATALRGMAVQAIDAGHRATAVRLAEECVHQARDLDDPRAHAYYRATLAQAAALDQDHATATRLLTSSQTCIERAPTTISGTSWASHYSIGRWAHETGMILARLGELDEARTHLHHALDIHGLDRKRTRAIVLADLGEVHLRSGDTEGAIATWNEFVTCADGLQSLKVDTAAQDMRARLHRLRRDGVPGADDLEQRARTTWTPLGAR